MSDWHLPENVEAIAVNTRVCWNCRHCMRWTATPGSWVGRCLQPNATDYREWVRLESDTCGYFSASESWGART